MSTALFLSLILLIDGTRPDWTITIELLINVAYNAVIKIGSCL